MASIPQRGFTTSVPFDDLLRKEALKKMLSEMTLVYRSERNEDGAIVKAAGDETSD